MNFVYPIAGCAEPISCWSHLAAAVGLLVLTIFLVRRLLPRHPLYALGIGLFGAACIFLLSISAYYHMLPLEHESRDSVQRLDHAAIYLVIASTICVVHTIIFVGWRRWAVISFVMALALTVITYKSIYFEQVPEYLGLISYLGFGWLGLFSAVAIWKMHGLKFIMPLFYGGIAYSIGAVLEFFREPVLISGYVGPHEIFHFAVVLGMGFHWYFVVAALGRSTEISAVSLVESTPEGELAEIPLVVNRMLK